MAGAEDDQNRQDEKAERRAARERITAYHRDQLRILLEHVRSGFDRLEAGEIDEFELDDLIFHYKQSAKELWKFCELPRNALQAASALITGVRRVRNGIGGKRGTAATSILLTLPLRFFISGAACVAPEYRGFAR